MNKSVDYIIVGMGLAGATLALRLTEQGKNILVFDVPSKNKSSAIAAGLFNPITGKMMAKTWLADQLFPELHEFYSWGEQVLKKKFYHPQFLYRPFLTVEEQNEWMGKSAEPSLRNYVQGVYSKSVRGQQVNDLTGGIELKHSGYLSVLTFLIQVKEYLVSKKSYRAEWFDESLLTTDSQSVQYKEIEAQRIIFCEGTHALSSHLTNVLPLRVLKGEVLEIELSQEPELIYNRGVFIVPMEVNGKYKIGATYELNNLAPEITEAGKAELVEKLEALIRIPYNIVGQDWGYRPTTPDRKPILGALPGNENIVIFNGLGTKGVSLAPYFSKQLANWLTGKGEIQADVNINRFKSLFSKSTVK